MLFLGVGWSVVYGCLFGVYWVCGGFVGCWCWLGGCFDWGGCFVCCVYGVDCGLVVDYVVWCCFGCCGV